MCNLETVKGRGMDDLHAVLSAALALLSEGAATPESPWRTLTFVTLCLDGAPAPRTVVLRAFDAESRLAEFHTDSRSPKCAQVVADPRAALHGWDATRRIQIRGDGRVLPGDRPRTERAWAALPDKSRSTYKVANPPGAPIARPEQSAADVGDEQAKAVFRVLLFRFDSLEVLSLAREGHRRARFRWPDGRLEATWLAP